MMNDEQKAAAAKGLQVFIDKINAGEIESIAIAYAGPNNYRGRVLMLSEDVDQVCSVRMAIGTLGHSIDAMMDMEPHQAEGMN